MMSEIRTSCCRMRRPVGSLLIGPESTTSPPGILKVCMQFIYTMKGLGKIHPPDTQVLRDIWLSFLPGAKIGVLGMNGAGKSSLLKIMAGEDHHFVGEAFPAAGIKVGFLHQEPRLNAAKNVLGNVEEGVQATRDLLNRFDELNM